MPKISKISYNSVASDMSLVFYKAAPGLPQCVSLNDIPFSIDDYFILNPDQFQLNLKTYFQQQIGMLQLTPCMIISPQGLNDSWVDISEYIQTWPNQDVAICYSNKNAISLLVVKHGSLVYKLNILRNHTITVLNGEILFFNPQDDMKFTSLLKLKAPLASANYFEDSDCSEPENAIDFLTSDQEDYIPCDRDMCNWLLPFTLEHFIESGMRLEHVEINHQIELDLRDLTLKISNMLYSAGSNKHASFEETKQNLDELISPYLLAYYSAQLQNPIYSDTSKDIKYKEIIRSKLNYLYAAEEYNQACHAGIALAENEPAANENKITCLPKIVVNSFIIEAARIQTLFFRAEQIDTERKNFHP